MLLRTAFIVLMGLCSIAASAQPTWKRIGDIAEPRFFFDSYPISQNEVLMIGGHPRGMAVLDASSACDILDVDRRTVVPGPRMKVPHAAYSSMQMPDGSIVVIGGMTGQNLVTTDVIERFDPVRRTWNIVGNLQASRMHIAAMALDSHRILIAGGRLGISLDVVRSCEIFDLRTGVSTPIGDLPTGMADGSVARAKTGQILAFGGRNGGAGSDRYGAVYSLDTVLMRWTLAGDFPSPIVTRAVVRLMNGDLMVAGGSYKEYNNPAMADRMSNGIFRWNGSAFDSIGIMRYARILHQVLQYDDNRLLVVGGKIPPKLPTARCEWIDIRTGRSTLGPDMGLDRAHVSLIGVTRNNRKLVFAAGGITTNDVATTVVEELTVSCDENPGTIFGTQEVHTAGQARSSNDGVVLTEAQPFSAGAVWGRSQVDVRWGFTTSFMFRLTDGHNNEQPDGSLPGADGMAFVIQNSGPSALGELGEGIGYGGIPKSLAVEFDTYGNPAYGDPNGNHIAVQSGGLEPCSPEHIAPYNLGIETNIVTMIPDGRVYYGRVDYHGSRLSVYLDTTGRFDRPALIVDGIDIARLLGLDPSGRAWIGFTSATGKSVERHELLAWAIDACARLTTSVQDEAVMPGMSGENQAYIAPMPSNGKARLVATMDFKESVKVTLTDVTGTTLGTATMGGADLRHGVELPFQPPSGRYYIHVADGVRSVTVPWIVLR